LQTCQWIDWFTNDLFRRFRCDGFDFNPAFRAGDNYGRGCRSIEQDGKINLARNVGGFRNEQFAYFATSCSCLVRYEDLTQHLCCDVAHIRWTLANMHPAFKSVFEHAFTAPASMNLRFNDHINVAELTRDLFRLVNARRDPASRGRYIEFLEQFFGLVFVNVHRLVTAEVELACRARISKRISHNVLALREHSPLPCVS
jgi:hypothetical protein